MSSAEDTDWLDALAGRTDAGIAESGATARPGADATQSRALALEALLLRRFIQSQQSDIASHVPTVDAAREQELIERARAEGLLSEERTPGHLIGSAPPRRHRLFADTRIRYAAAAMVIIAAGAGFWQSLLPPDETLRGTVNGIVQLEARDPPALKRELTAELAAAGVRVSGYERLGHVGIDAELPQPVSAPIAAVLARHHIPVPADGVLTVEIDAPVHR